MYSIGEFSVMLNLNKKTLRYYDDIGLFKPAHVDESNQYRYYEENQIEKIKEILRLRNIGITLEQIKLIVNQDNEKLTEIYNQRLLEIEDAERLLERQKKLILKYKTVENNECMVMPALNVGTGYFLEKGFIYYQRVNCELEEVNDSISEFYEKSHGTLLKGSHIFKMNLEDNTFEVSEIFAYTSEQSGALIRTQERELCLKVECKGMKEKTAGYKTIFDFAEKNKYTIKNVYEKYSLETGRMHIEIICSIY